MLVINPESLEQIRRHAAETYPNECCGLLIGNIRDGRVFVSEVCRISNIHEESTRTRYMGDPHEQFRAMKEARERGMDMVGVYHSHPDVPPRPSLYDLQHAWPGYVYLILTVRQGQPDEMCAWRLNNSETAFEQVEIAYEGNTA